MNPSSTISQGLSSQRDKTQRNKEGRDKRPSEYPNASSPRQLRWSDWKEILWRVKSEVAEDQVGIMAAGIAYYALFSLFPLLIATVSIYGLFADPAQVEQHVAFLYEIMPKDAAQLIADQMHTIASNSSTKLGLSALFSILVALWTASSGSKSLMQGMNIAYDEEEKRGFIRLQLQALLLTLGGVVTVLAAATLVAILPVVLDFIGLGSLRDDILLLLRWPLLILLFGIGLAIVNRFGPSRSAPKWRWITVGTVAATAIILLASVGLAFYVERFGSYNKTYGSIAGVVVLLLWLYLLSYAVLLGTELNSEIEHQTRHDSTTGPQKPMGQRGAVKADSLPNEAEGRAST